MCVCVCVCVCVTMHLVDPIKVHVSYTCLCACVYVHVQVLHELHHKLILSYRWYGSVCVGSLPQVRDQQVDKEGS